jgi:hypothetical protein
MPSGLSVLHLGASVEHAEPPAKSISRMVFFGTNPNQSHIVKKNTIFDNGFVLAAKRLRQDRDAEAQ